MYQVKFVDTGHIDEVETGDIAVATVPMYDPDIKRTNYIGNLMNSMLLIH